jgi:hypothetical protein
MLFNLKKIIMQLFENFTYIIKNQNYITSQKQASLQVGHKSFVGSRSVSKD